MQNGRGERTTEGADLADSLGRCTEAALETHVVSSAKTEEKKRLCKNRRLTGSSRKPWRERRVSLGCVWTYWGGCWRLEDGSIVADDV